MRVHVPMDHMEVLYLSSNPKLLQMQEYTHVLMHLSTRSPPYVPYNAPMPHACKQVLNTCPTVRPDTQIVVVRVHCAKCGTRFGSSWVKLGRGGLARAPTPVASSLPQEHRG